MPLNENDRKCDLCIGSLNARGLNKAVKRKSVFDWATRNRFDILYLQETFSTKDVESQWRKEWGGHIIYAHGTNHSKGTMVLFKPDFDGRIISEICDINGRYIIVKLEMNEQKFTMLNIYVPSKEHEKITFFYRLKKHFKLY